MGAESGLPSTCPQGADSGIFLSFFLYCICSVEVSGTVAYASA